MSPREPRAPNQRRLDGPSGGPPPLLQGHLKPKKRRAGAEDSQPDPSSRPVESAAPPEAKGKRTRGEGETATLEHLEGAEQGPM